MFEESSNEVQSSLLIGFTVKKILKVVHDNRKQHMGLMDLTFPVQLIKQKNIDWNYSFEIFSSSEPSVLLVKSFFLSRKDFK